ncbi:MAG TPA: hypothetical protein VN231_11320 [Allosphingosinicella sp.]|nr:hypothetical protein [Allosphingosinicella sp.]
MDKPRIVVSLEELGLAIRLWIRAAPTAIWKRDELYEQLKAQKRHDPERAPDPRSDLAAYITDRFARAEWEVTRPEPDNLLADRPEAAPKGGAQGNSRPGAAGDSH